MLPVPAWLEGRGGRPEGYCHRVMLDAVFYVVDNGIKWRNMPVDFPAWDRGYAFWRRRRKNGLIDSQSVKADTVVGDDSRGYDGAKKINVGRVGARCGNPSLTQTRRRSAGE